MNKNKTYCFDLDGVICNNTFGRYDEAQPYLYVINKINNLYDNGSYIIIFTARYMGKFKNNKSKVISFGFKKTKKQLDSWGLRYNKLILGKPEYDVIVDDKSIFYNKNWIDYISE